MQNENKTDNKNINVVGVKVLEQNGINVDEIIKLLVSNASVEFTAYYYFTNLINDLVQDRKEKVLKEL